MSRRAPGRCGMLRATMSSPALIHALLLVGLAVGPLPAMAQAPPSAPKADAFAAFTTSKQMPVRAFPLDVDVAVVQLWLRIPPELAAADRQALRAYAQALAEGRQSPSRPTLAATVQALSGTTSVHIDADAIVVSMTVPGRHLATALALADARLSGRTRLLPVDKTHHRWMAPVPMRVPQEVLQLWAPNHPYQVPLASSNASPAAADLRRISSQLMRRGLVEVVVGTQLGRRPLAVLLDRHLRTRLPTAKGGPLPALAPLPGHHTLDVQAAWPADAVHVFVPLPRATTVQEQAILEVVAAHLDARVLEQQAGTLLQLEAANASAQTAVAARLEGVGTLSEPAFNRAKARAISRVSSLGRTVEGQVFYAASTSIHGRIAALQTLTRADIGAFFRDLQSAPRIVARQAQRGPPPEAP